MTRLHHWPHRAAPGVRGFEDWDDATARNMAEVLGQTAVGSLPVVVDCVPEWEESGRDRVVRRYSFRVYRLKVAPGMPLAPCVIGQWLTPAEIHDAERRPLSPTARFVLRQCEAAAASQGTTLFG